jgi:hypothetical protein
MKRFLILLIFCLVFLTVPVFAQTTDHFATCDQCGYCPKTDATTGACIPQNPPGSWQSCANCLYGDLSPDPTTCNTLKINPDTNLPPSPRSGTWYTMIGCVDVGVAGFSQSGAAGGLVQMLLNIVFSIAGGITLLYLLYGAFLVLTSQAEPEKLQQGKQIIWGAIIGLGFTLASVFLVNLLASGILKIPGFSQ